jgi:hypothetical protein
VPGFVPEIRAKARIACAEEGGTSVYLYKNTAPRIASDGAGRGNRTPMELLPTDFEFPTNTVSL